MIDTKQITCEPCGGFGRLGTPLGETTTCGKCAGTGRVDGPEQDDYSDPLIVPDYAALNADTLGKGEGRIVVGVVVVHARKERRLAVSRPEYAVEGEVEAIAEER